MDIVWVVSLILVLVSIRPSLIEATGDALICSPGQYKDAKHNSCKMCDEGTFTEINNTRGNCLKCSNCGQLEVKKRCTTTSNVVCDCPDRMYSKDGECTKCSNHDGGGSEDYRDRCQSPTSSIITPSTAPTAGLVTAKTVTTASTTSPATQKRRLILSTSHTTRELPKSDNLFIWLSYVGAIVISLVVFWLLLVFFRSLLRKEDVLPCWNTKKFLERLPQEPKFNEQHSHHCSSPTMLTYTLSEETPMMPLCQEPSAHISGHMHQGVHTDGRRYEHSDRWPAIVIYAIIKEVPLRRWKEFLRLLSVSDQQMERVELDTGLGSIEKQYQMLRLWSQRSSASLNDIYSSLHQMDLSGCAQQLQENLERLQWRCEARQGLMV